MDDIDFSDSNNEEFEENNNINETLYYDSVIFLVQICDKLFEKIDNLENSDTFYNMIIKAYENFLKCKIISNSSDYVSLIFYDTNKSYNYLDFKNIYEFQTLTQPSAKIINMAEDLFINIPEKGEKSNFCDLIWLCSTLFRDKLIKKNNFKRIFLFTEDEYPFEPNFNFEEGSKKLLNEINECGIEIELFPIIKGEQIFDLSKFYINFINFDEDEINMESINTLNKFKDLYSKLKKKEFRKKIIAKGELTLGNDLDIGINFYSLVKKMNKPSPNYLNKVNNRPVKKLTKLKCLETNKFVPKDKIGKYVEIGGEKIVFDEEEIEEMKKFESPQLTLLGFKPINRIKPYYNLRNSYFIYPDENRISNSSSAVDGLIKEMKSMDKVAICKFITKKSGKIKIVALIPQLETYCEDKFSNPPGFNMIFLPFKNDIRDLNLFKPINNDKTLPNKKDVSIASDLIEKLTYTFDISLFENQELQRFYTYLQSLALKKKTISDDDKNYLIPDEEIYTNLTKEIEKFKNHYDRMIEINLESSSSEDEEKIKIIKKKIKKKKNKLILKLNNYFNKYE